MTIEIKGLIMLLREAEDCIRSTKKYTKGASARGAYQYPVQGEEFPSKVLTEHYDVYPDLNSVGWDMTLPDAWRWFWGDAKRVQVNFYYDYRENKAALVIKGGSEQLAALKAGIPGLASVLERVAQPERDSKEGPLP